MEITSEQRATDQARSALKKYSVWTLVAAAVIVHLLIAARSVGPMYAYDEVGYLAGANVLSGNGVAWSLCGSSYSVGYSVLLAPLWWLNAQPIVIYQMAALFSAALGALAIWPATALARRFGASGAAAIAIGALVTLVPARALMNNYVIAENPLTLLVLCSALLALRIAERGRRLDTIALGLTVGLAAVVHARAIPLVAVTLVWLVVRAILKRTRWLDSIIAVVLAGALTATGLVAQARVGSQIFADDTRVGDLIGPGNLGRVVQVILGQGFTQVVSWSLLTALGILACASSARAAVRRGGPQGLASAWWWLGPVFAAQAAFFVWVLASSAEFGTRLDLPIFGRYLDPFAVPIAVLGATTLWIGVRKRLTNVALVASATAVVAYIALVLPRLPLDGVWVPFAIPGLTPFMSLTTGDDRAALAVAGLVAIATCFLLWLSRGKAKVGLAVTLAVVTLVTLGTDALRIDPQEEGVRASSTILTFVNANPDIPTTLAADLLPCADRNKLQLELAGRAPIVTTGGNYGEGAIVGPKDWPAAKADGLKIVPFTVWESAAIWAHILNTD